MLFGEAEPFTSADLPAQDFSIIADMLLHELQKVWYEDAQKILKTSDKEPTSVTG